uniref:Uncharacterized protein n=1 Tax=Arundo donax TaxID=35708 RepID=A0A0A8YQM9_ARUDO
MFKPCLTSP